MRMIETIKTERLELRPMLASDAVAFFEFYSDPETMRFIGAGKTVDSVDEVRLSIEKHQKTHYQEHGLGLWAVRLAESETLIGHCGVLFWEIDGFREHEIAYLLGKQFCGKGYATEAAIAVRDWGFRKRKFSRMVSLMYPDNLSSKKVAERVGMQYEKSVTIMENVEVHMYALKNPNSADTVTPNTSEEV